MESLSSIVFHTVILKMLIKDERTMKCEHVLKIGKNQEMWLRFYIEDKVGVSIIYSIPHCHAENVLKTGDNQEMFLRYYKDDKNGVSIIDSIPHCHTENACKRCKN